MTETAGVNQEVRKRVEQYRKGCITRRELLISLTSVLGTYGAAHHFLESSGLASTLISERETQASNLAAETVRFPSGQFQIEGYLVKPNRSGRSPAVLVIHENRGLNEHIRDVARRFADEGFVALAPDLLSRVGGTAGRESERAAIEAIGLLPAYDLLNDLKASFEFLANHSDVEVGEIASVGFCWGGWRSFMLATMEPRLYRAVVFYGSSPDSGFDNIQAPVLAHYAAWDNRITGNAIWTDQMMQQVGKRFQYHVYPETDHAFFNDTGTRHNPRASAQAWSRTLEFLRN